jgi:hypothetical protein
VGSRRAHQHRHHRARETPDQHQDEDMAALIRRIRPTASSVADCPAERRYAIILRRG